MKFNKNRKSEQGYQDLCWKVQDRTQSFILRSYTMRDQSVPIG